MKRGYLILLLLLDLILPLTSIFLDHAKSHAAIDPALVGKWVLFFSVGLRLFIAGLVQVLIPEFTATRIFRLRHKESYTVIRELGFGNISMGVIAMLSLAKVEWRGITSIAAGDILRPRRDPAFGPEGRTVLTRSSP